MSCYLSISLTISYTRDKGSCCNPIQADGTAKDATSEKEDEIQTEKGSVLASCRENSDSNSEAEGVASKSILFTRKVLMSRRGREMLVSTIHFSDSKPGRTAPLPPPRGRSPGIRSWASHWPCTSPSKIFIDTSYFNTEENSGD